MNSQLFLMIRSLRYASIFFRGFVLYFLREFLRFLLFIWGMTALQLRQHGDLLRELICEISFSAYVTAKSPQQRLIRILTVKAKGFDPWASGLFPSFWIEGDLPFFFRANLTFFFRANLTFFFRANLTFRLDLPASTRGQASEASWFPGMWVNRVCDSTVQMLIHYGE